MDPAPRGGGGSIWKLPIWCDPGTAEILRHTAYWRRQMLKRQSGKYKLDRRMGENIWGRTKSPVNRREYGPGQHGQRRKGKMSDFGIQLRAKQKDRKSVV